MTVEQIFEQILKNRGISKENREAFLNPNYDNQHDPFLLPDMEKAVERLLIAHKKQEKITVYGDYDVDGVSASTVILTAFEKFGFKNVDYFLPDRFKDIRRLKILPALEWRLNWFKRFKPNSRAFLLAKKSGYLTWWRSAPFAIL